MTDGVVTPVRAGTAGLRDLVTLYSERYDRPIAVTETSLVGTVEDRMEWLHASTAELAELRAEGHEIIGYTWFPFFTMVDWLYRFDQKTPDEWLDRKSTRLNSRH